MDPVAFGAINRITLDDVEGFELIRIGEVANELLLFLVVEVANDLMDLLAVAGHDGNAATIFETSELGLERRIVFDADGEIGQVFGRHNDELASEFGHHGEFRHLC